MLSQVYVNHGRVVVDCPYECGNAFQVTRGQTAIVCNPTQGGCGRSFDLAIDSQLSEIVEELSNRRDPKTQNWFPSEHPLAVRGGLPHGQTVADLVAEHEMHRDEENTLEW